MKNYFTAFLNSSRTADGTAQPLTARARFFLILLAIVLVAFMVKYALDKFVEPERYLRYNSNYQLLKDVNAQLIETLKFYEENIHFSDSAYSKINAYVNVPLLIELYDKTRKNVISNAALAAKDSALYNKLVKEDYHELMNVGLGNINKERKRWKPYLDRMNACIESSSLRYENGQTTPMTYAGYSLVQTELLYNLAFQLALRHKMEEEYRFASIIPVVENDLALPNGRRRLEIIANVGLVEDGLAHELMVGNEKIPFNTQNPTNSMKGFYEYDPRLVADSIEIYLNTYMLLNGQRERSQLNYKPQK